MPRRARLVIPGVPWHIIQRGNNRSACFYTEDDYHRYLDTLGEQADKYCCSVHAYVLMTNHVHLLLTPEKEDSASLLMKHLGQRYVQYINRTHRRSGTLWEGRFKSCLVQTETYVLLCYRYIELNPVRAKMTRHPGGYKWSSYLANAEGHLDPLLKPHDAYLRLGQSAQDRLSFYQDLFQNPLSDERIRAIRGATNGNYALGDHRFQTEMGNTLNRRVTPGKCGRPKRDS